MRLAVDSADGLGNTTLKVTDKAVEVCPVASLMPKRTAFEVPYGEHRFDLAPIGSDIEASARLRRPRKHQSARKK